MQNEYLYKHTSLSKKISNTHSQLIKKIALFVPLYPLSCDWFAPGVLIKVLWPASLFCLRPLLRRRPGRGEYCSLLAVG